MGVTATLAFGFPVNTLDGRDAALGEDLSLILPAIVRRLLSPVPYWRWLKTPADRELARAMEQLFDRLRGTMKAARERAGSGGAETFLEALTQAQSDDGQPYSEEVILANALTMLLGGQDTAASTLAWAVHVLADRPDWLEALREEADRAGSEPASVATESARFPLTLAFASEVMRTRPPIPYFSLEAGEDLIVRDVLVPRGAPIHVVSRPTLERTFEGDGALRFDPRRWLEPERERDARQHDFSFGTGPRACPGRTLALLEMRLVLSMLSQNFDIERVGAHDDVRELTQLTMIPQGLRVRLAARAAP